MLRTQNSGIYRYVRGGGKGLAQHDIMCLWCEHIVDARTASEYCFCRRCGKRYQHTWFGLPAYKVNGGHYDQVPRQKTKLQFVSRL